MERVATLNSSGLNGEITTWGGLINQVKALGDIGNRTEVELVLRPSSPGGSTATVNRIERVRLDLARVLSGPVNIELDAVAVLNPWEKSKREVDNITVTLSFQSASGPDGAGDGIASGELEKKDNAVSVVTFQLNGAEAVSAFPSIDYQKLKDDFCEVYLLSIFSKSQSQGLWKDRHYSLSYHDGSDEINAMDELMLACKEHTLDRGQFEHFRRASDLQKEIEARDGRMQQIWQTQRDTTIRDMRPRHTAESLDKFYSELPERSKLKVQATTYEEYLILQVEELKGLSRVFWLFHATGDRNQLFPSTTSGIVQSYGFLKRELGDFVDENWNKLYNAGLLLDLGTDVNAQGPVLAFSERNTKETLHQTRTKSNRGTTKSTKHTRFTANLLPLAPAVPPFPLVFTSDVPDTLFKGISQSLPGSESLGEARHLVRISWAPGFWQRGIGQSADMDGNRWLTEASSEIVFSFVRERTAQYPTSFTRLAEVARLPVPNWEDQCLEPPTTRNEWGVFALPCSKATHVLYRIRPNFGVSSNKPDIERRLLTHEEIESVLKSETELKFKGGYRVNSFFRDPHVRRVNSDGLAYLSAATPRIHVVVDMGKSDVSRYIELNMRDNDSEFYSPRQGAFLRAEVVSTLGTTQTRTQSRLCGRQGLHGWENTVYK